MPRQTISRITVIGVGLLGGSIAKAARRRWKSAQIIGLVRSEAKRRLVKRIGIFDEVRVGFSGKVDPSGLVVICTPPSEIESICKELVALSPSHTTVTDVASVKGSVEKIYEGCRRRSSVAFIGSHPMAGSEKSGVQHSSEALLNGKYCIVTPSGENSRSTVDLVKAFWSGLGMKVVEMDPVAHDENVSRSSHLVHLIASCLASHVLKSLSRDIQPAVCAGGFTSTTRVASGDAKLWAEITAANAGPVSKAMRGFLKDAARVQRWIDRGDIRSLERFLLEARELREGYLARASVPRKRKLDGPSGE